MHLRHRLPRAPLQSREQVLDNPSDWIPDSGVQGGSQVCFCPLGRGAAFAAGGRLQADRRQHEAQCGDMTASLTNARPMWKMVHGQGSSRPRSRGVERRGAR